MRIKTNHRNDNKRKSFVCKKGEKYECNLCEIEPGEKSIIIQHIQSDHDEEVVTVSEQNKVECETCDQEFTNADDLNNHRSQNHSIITMSSQQSVDGEGFFMVTGSNMLECTLCHKQ